MKISDYITNYQPILYKLLSNLKKNNDFSQAYLINGSIGAPLLDVATYFAKAIFCKDEKVLVCDVCPSCEKISNNNFLPLIIIDGENKTIVKDDVKAIIENFSSSSLEKSLLHVYIINCVENMTTEAINSLLKFLEEPNRNVFAILTTKNVRKVLPTILSRCQVISLRQIDKNEIVNEAIKDGVKVEDAELLSLIYSTSEDILKASNDDSFESFKKPIHDYLNSLSLGVNDSKYVLETNVLPSIKTKYDAAKFIDILISLLTNAVSYHETKTTSLNSYVNTLELLYNNIANINDKIFNIYLKKADLNININTNLVLLEINNILLGE